MIYLYLVGLMNQLITGGAPPCSLRIEYKELILTALLGIMTQNWKNRIGIYNII